MAEQMSTAHCDRIPTEMIKSVSKGLCSAVIDLFILFAKGESGQEWK